MLYIKRVLLIISGTVALLLGVAGIVLPLLPTTPFLLLAAACYVRSSDKLYDWLISNKWFGHYIANYRAGKGIPLKAKIIGITMIWLSISYTALFVVPLLVIKLLLLVVAGYFTWFILKIKTS